MERDLKCPEADPETDPETDICQTFIEELYQSDIETMLLVHTINIRDIASILCNY